MFEKAARMKIRFEYKGQSSVEDLWDLSPKELDDIYKDLRMEQREKSEDSLLEDNKATAADLELNLKVGIVKHIVNVKLAEAEASKRRQENKMFKERVANIIAAKQDLQLQAMPIEELQAMLADEPVVPSEPSEETE